MPLEIRELIIRATVSGQGGSASAGGSSAEAPESEALLNEIAEKVFEIIRNKQER